VTRLFIARRDRIPHDGTRRLIAGGRVERQDAEAVPEDDPLIAGLAGAARKAEEATGVRDAGREAWHARQQRGGEPQ
jgi:hypothetical protein